MAVACLSDRSVWVWSPIALTEELATDVEALGPIRYIISPNKIHHLFLPEWANRWPEARLYAPPGLARKRADLNFHAELGNDPATEWATEIDQIIFRGSFAMEEVAFFHRPSKTAILCDLIQRFPSATVSGWRGTLMRLNNLVGEAGSTPREWRASFIRRGPARAAREKVLSWDAERLLIAHGECSQTDATAIIAKALRWI